jgi:hypothetical protein
LQEPDLPGGHHQKQHRSTCPEIFCYERPECYAIITDQTVKDRYEHRLTGLFTDPRHQIQTVLFLTDLVYKLGRLWIETAEPPELPAGAKVPHEDEYVVRAALISRPLVVSAEEKLLKAINTQPALRLKALTPSEALERARER